MENVKDDNLIILGGWNVIVGEGQEGEVRVVGKYGLGVINNQGQRVAGFCEEKKHNYKHHLSTSESWSPTLQNAFETLRAKYADSIHLSSPFRQEARIYYQN
jgi:hypothetical protein